MKAIDYVNSLKKKLTNNLAPISKGEINLLIDMIEKEQAEKPTVVVNIGGGLVAYIAASCDVNVVVVDQDIEGYSDPLKETPSGHTAVVYISPADIVTKERIDEWLALANQE